MLSKAGLGCIVGISRVNALGSDQPELLIFTDRHGRLIGDVELHGIPDDSNLVPDDTELPGVDPAINDDIEIPGVDAVEVLEDPDPREIEIDDLNIHEPDPPPIQVETVTEAEVPQEPPEPPVLQPVLPVLWRSTRDRTQTSSGYVPSLSGTKYSYAATQLESHGVLHPDAHMFTQGDFYQSEPDVVAMVMTQLSLKVGLKAWGDNAHTAA
jgi:hypothetical protein